MKLILLATVFTLIALPVVAQTKGNAKDQEAIKEHRSEVAGRLESARDEGTLRTCRRRC